MRTDTARKVAYIGFCVFTGISVVVVLFGWEQKNREIAECWKFSEALISIKTCAKWGPNDLVSKIPAWLSIRDTKRDISRATQYDPLFSPSEKIHPVHCLHCICGHREVCTARMTAWLPFVVVLRQSSPKKLLVMCRPIVGLHLAHCRWL